MVIAMRNTFLIDPDGKIVKVWTKVDPNVHSEEVLAALSIYRKSRCDGREFRVSGRRLPAPNSNS